MEFRRTVRISAGVADVWALVDDVPAVAGCIPGLGDLEMTGDHEFDCVVNQRVGSVKSSFKLHNVIGDLDPNHSLTVVSEGRDAKLNSQVKATQEFTFRPDGHETEVDIVADFQVTGRIATFGHRIILAKAEQVTVEALRNVERLLEQRRADVTG
jgi:carbon monoxide dehydrogenase subunit G